MKLLVASALDGLDRNTRLWNLLYHLEARGHTIAVAGSGRGFGRVAEKVDRTFSIAYKTPMGNETQDELNWKVNRGLIERVERFQPEAMILDGELFAANVAQRLHIPTISIDHMHLFQYARLDITIPPANLEQLIETKDKVKARKYNASHYILPLFFSPTPSADFVTVAQSVSREQINHVTPTDGEEMVAFAWPHIQSDLGHFNQLEQSVIAQIPIRKNRANTERVLFEREVRGSQGNLLRRRKEKLPKKLEASEMRSMLPENEHGITYEVADPDTWFPRLAASKAVLMDGELTAITEAIALKKPMLLIPNPRRFDQWCYAHYVEKFGFGEYHPRLTRTVLEGFLSRIERYKENLQKTSAQGPTLLEAVDKKLAEIRR